MTQESSTELLSPLTILVVDDESSVRSAISLVLGNRGYSVVECGSASDGIAQLQHGRFDIVLSDLRLPDSEGFSFITQAKHCAPDTAIVIMTGFGNHELALQAMRAGAYDYLSKPFTMDELVLTLQKIEEREELRKENAALRSDLTQNYQFSNIVAQSEAMRTVFDTVKRLAEFNTTVLITGESGTGKELLARAIHHNSPRRGKSFVAVNCGAIPENLVESELFGHKRGSFTDATRDKRGLFEEADGGTIFLDEIGELPVHLQVKLLRALQERQIRRVGDEAMLPIDVRVVAATLRDLEADVAAGRFRDDLFYRLNVVSINIPALRERNEDIPVLVKHFIKKHNKRLGLSIKGIAPEAMRCLMDYGWRGNVRELENCIERALVLSEGLEIVVDALPPAIRASATQNDRSAPGIVIEDGDLSIKKRTRALETALIEKALRKTKGNRTHAAKALEISHRALLYKIKEYGIR